MKNKRNDYIILNNEEIEQVKILYKTLPIYKIAEILGICDKTLVRNLKQNKFVFKTATERSTRYTENQSFFNNPKNWEQKHAYFLGWLMSDGHHNVKIKTIQISLQEKDKKILQILKNIIEYTGPLTYQKRNGINNFIKNTTVTYQNRWRLGIKSNNISNDLLKLKIDNNKTNNLEFPTYLKEDLISHYLRSFYEGDGTVSYSMYPNNIMKFSLNVIGTKLFVNYLQSLLKQKLNIESAILDDGKMKNGNVVLRISGLLNSLIFFNYVYKDARFLLKRKFRKFLRLVNHLRHKTNWKNKNKQHLINKELKISISIAKDIIKNAQY
jgi:hypothetical protein